jgi:predicted HNH restriction endonuclease
MASSVLKTIARIDDFQKLEILGENIRRGDALTSEVEAALRSKYAELGLDLVAERTGLDLDDLSPVEEKIVEAVAKYVGLQKRDGKTANRTFQMLANRGLIESAEISVSKSKPTQGFEVLEDADLKALSFEQIIVDFPDEFSSRALWYSRKTLGLPNESEKPPASATLNTQVRSEELLGWYRQRLSENGGLLSGHSNEDAGKVLGFSDLSKHGRVLGNITSRIDFACYACGLPPLGLTAQQPFGNAWSTQNRLWKFPVDQMKQAAQTKRWTAEDIDRITAKTAELPGTASIPWKKEISQKESAIRDWAFSLHAFEDVQQVPFSPTDKQLANEVSKAAELERLALGQTPEAKQKTSLAIERGPIGNAVKKATGHKCQLCEALGLPPYGFKKRNGVPYVEAHHVTPVSELQIGSLAASNILTLCANHHRQMHYGDVSVEIHDKLFVILFEGQQIILQRMSFISPPIRYRPPNSNPCLV